MTRLKKARGLLLAGALLIALCAVASAGESNQIKYYINPIFPTNQLDGSIGYFSLLTQPESTQILQVRVFNEDSEDIQVTVEVNNAFTNQNGAIEYGGGEGAESNDSGLAGMITIEEPEPCVPENGSAEGMVTDEEPRVLCVPAKGSAIVALRLTMPKEPIDGELLAGVVITRIPDEEEDDPEASGMRIVNIFAYCAPIRVTQSTTQPPAPDFALTGVRMDTIAGFPAVALDVVNLRPMICSAVELQASIYPQKGGEPVLSYEMTVSMSPRVSAPLSHMLMDEEKLSPGAYRVETTLVYEEQTWHFEMPLVVE